MYVPNPNLMERPEPTRGSRRRLYALHPCVSLRAHSLCNVFTPGASSLGTSSEPVDGARSVSEPCDVLGHTPRAGESTQQNRPAALQRNLRRTNLRSATVLPNTARAFPPQRAHRVRRPAHPWATSARTSASCIPIRPISGSHVRVVSGPGNSSSRGLGSGGYGLKSGENLSGYHSKENNPERISVAHAALD
ncbi:hypothetical protein PHLGIDRAFT_222891 [Phlebiopsis gigantea 11061_1 CR5-6]|uniref:Uncharacterized protein n=1 Tax=Phlebiopsis gigantea (strain 11061_1 CR5-6) TaxID=745531 RepID=A0A0C3S2H9_PHLG1|nr:hypothetical protein PHLGIDRAFT_222891 [Phlebiopsis gigantea 11061_1 CR5-6]